MRARLGGRTPTAGFVRTKVEMASILVSLPSDIWAEIVGWLDLFELARTIRSVNSRFLKWVDLFLCSTDGSSALFCVGIAYQLGVQNKPIIDDLGRRIIVESAKRGNPSMQGVN